MLRQNRKCITDMQGLKRKNAKDFDDPWLLIHHQNQAKFLLWPILRWTKSGQSGAWLKGFFHRPVHIFSGTYPGIGHRDSRLSRVALLSFPTAVSHGPYWGLNWYIWTRVRSWIMWTAYCSSDGTDCRINMGRTTGLIHLWLWVIF